ANLIADNFPEVVAQLPPIGGDMLTDPREGFWRGSRFLGTRRIAILRNGQVVGIRRRVSDKEVVPPEVVRRDPNIDVRDAWVAIDFGTRNTVVAVGNGEGHELIRIGANREPTVAADYEIPTEIAFINLPAVLKAWSDRVILPLTQWGDLYVGHGSAARRHVHGKERAQRYKATLQELAALPGRLAAGEKVTITGRSDLDSPLVLDKPAPPIIDEEGIGPDDPFDPIELFAYYIGLNVNDRRRGIHLRYAIGMPTGWATERRTQLLAEFRRGIMRSLPAGMVAYDDIDMLQVIDAGPNVLSFAAYGFRVFGIAPKGDEAVPFVSIDAGACEVAILCGLYRRGKPDEVAAGFERIVEHVEPTVLSGVGAEQLLHRLAYRVYEASGSSMRSNDIPFVVPPGDSLIEGHEERLVVSADADANVRLLKDAVRNVLEKPGPSALPDLVQLFGTDGRVRDVRIMIDRAALSEWLRGQLSEITVAIKAAIDKGMDQVCRGDIPWADLRILLGGRLGMHAFLQERLDAIVPQGTRVHKFREPDETNVAAPTVKLATAFGILALRFQPMAPSEVTDDRASFDYKVGRAKRGVLLAVLDGHTGYDVWKELGACTRPEVTVLYTTGSAPDDIDADDPSVRSVVCPLGYDAVGYRVYLRAVGGHRVEVSVGPPGGRPDDDAPLWAVDLAAAVAEPMSR
ncbi:MAG: hypothetical protein KC731_18180, partial [Myxococcales bacterium]|nr:hypothetical protein [Myxococcales bacterium]